jgi:undecaprenol kinase/diacylglycerol kinase (ATP)
MSRKFSLKSRLRSFGYAFNGLKIVFREEHNAQIHLLAAVLAVVLGAFFHISITEWLLLVFVIAFVISLEIVNTAIENIANFVCQEQNEGIKKIKDIAAAAVLVSAIAALLVGLLIFIPKIIALYKSIS